MSDYDVTTGKMDCVCVELGGRKFEFHSLFMFMEDIDAIAKLGMKVNISGLNAHISKMPHGLARTYYSALRLDKESKDALVSAGIISIEAKGTKDETISAGPELVHAIEWLVDYFYTIKKELGESYLKSAP